MSSLGAISEAERPLCDDDRPQAIRRELAPEGNPL
jgi:hypothetical protein